jgi:hypothetical protein
VNTEALLSAAASKNIERQTADALNLLTQADQGRYSQANVITSALRWAGYPARNSQVKHTHVFEAHGVDVRKRLFGGIGKLDEEEHRNCS